MSSLIELQNVSKIYQTSDTALKALDDVSLQVQEHDLMAIIGASGSGKSTMMNIIGLLDRPTTGKLLLNGDDIASFNDNKLAEIRNITIGFVFQMFFLLPRLTAEQNVALPLLYRGVNLIDARKKAYEMLDKVGVARLAHKHPNQMSGGEQQRVAITRALVGDPDILLADEPTGALDSTTGQDILNLFIRLNEEEKRTVIVITHDPNISWQCKRIVTISDGKIINDMQQKQGKNP